MVTERNKDQPTFFSKALFVVIDINGGRNIIESEIAKYPGVTKNHRQVLAHI
jgi:hypothetical protein